MSNKTVCLTPNARWTFEFHPGEVSVKVWYNDMLTTALAAGLRGFSESEAVDLENALHDAIQPILAARWTAQNLEYERLSQGVPVIIGRRKKP